MIVQRTARMTRSSRTTSLASETRLSSCMRRHNAMPIASVSRRNTLLNAKNQRRGRLVGVDAAMVYRVRIDNGPFGQLE